MSIGMGSFVEGGRGVVGGSFLVDNNIGFGGSLGAEFGGGSGGCDSFGA